MDSRTSSESNQRIQILRHYMSEQNMLAFFVRDESSIRWLSDFDDVFDGGQAFSAWFSANQACLHTDSRYEFAVKKSLQLHKMKTACEQAQCLEDEGLQANFERKKHTSFAVEQLQRMCSSKGPIANDTSQLAPATEDSNLGKESLLQQEPIIGIESGLAVSEYLDLKAELDAFCNKQNCSPITLQVCKGIAPLRAVKSSKEIQRLKEAQAITDAAFAYICTYIKPGMTEKEVQLELDHFMRTHGADDLAFASIVATGVNGASPHAIPGSTILEAGQCMVLDFGAKKAGYCSDMTRMVFLGEPDSKMRAAYAALRDANETVEASLRPGVTGKQMHELAEQILTNHGFAGKMGHGLGHGVGLEIHEEPNLNSVNDRALAAGNVVTVEPGIYLEDEFGMRLEDFGVLTENGFEVFTQSSHEMVII